LDGQKAQGRKKILKDFHWLKIMLAKEIPKKSTAKIMVV
jgi:hypothetical protein